jgi:Putative MetA-pathway of phenol degradation
VRMMIVAGLLLASAAGAQDSINAERPGFSSSPLSVDRGRWQLEGGYQYQRIGSGVDAQAMPLMLLRYGAGERAEVQFSWSGFNRVDTGQQTIDGNGDASIGIKWQLTDNAATTPVGVFASLSLPVGDDAFSSDEVDPTIGLFWAHNGRLNLFGTVLLSEFDKETSIGNAIGISLPMSSRCGNCGAYIEYFGIHPEDGGPQHNLNGGVTFLRSADLQFDVHVGVGLNDRAPDSFLGLGAAYRF